MRRFTVVTTPKVDDQLAALILAHWGTPLAAQFVAAADRLDVELSKQPRESGVEATTGVYSVIIYALAAEYTVNDDDRLVRILGYSQANPDLSS